MTDRDANNLVWLGTPGPEIINVPQGAQVINIRTNTDSAQVLINLVAEIDVEKLAERVAKVIKERKNDGALA